MNVLVTIGALAFLMAVAYRGYSVILFAPVAALLAVLCTDPAAVVPSTLVIGLKVIDPRLHCPYSGQHQQGPCQFEMIACLPCGERLNAQA